MRWLGCLLNGARVSSEVQSMRPRVEMLECRQHLSTSMLATPHSHVAQHVRSAIIVMHPADDAVPIVTLNPPSTTYGSKLSGAIPRTLTLGKAIRLTQTVTITNLTRAQVQGGAAVQLYLSDIRGFDASTRAFSTSQTKYFKLKGRQKIGLTQRVSGIAGNIAAGVNYVLALVATTDQGEILLSSPKTIRFVPAKVKGH